MSCLSSMWNYRFFCLFGPSFAWLCQDACLLYIIEVEIQVRVVCVISKQLHESFCFFVYFIWCSKVVDSITCPVIYSSVYGIHDGASFQSTQDCVCKLVIIQYSSTVYTVGQC